MQYLRSLNGRLVVAALIAMVAGFGSTTSAEAGKRLNRHVVTRAKAHRVVTNDDIARTSRYAAIVIDDKTGKILYAKNADALRHPASLTKMMTLYVLFEEMRKKRITLNTRLQVSQRASVQAPTKLGLRPGSTIGVEDAIRALVTRSANDVAVTIAENIGGSEEAFAKRMTKTARSIGMRGTTFYNASGLPNAAQYSTARDMVTLGRALQERFPIQYRYFSTRSFAWGNSVIPNHNNLLRRLEGVDGIKTGYTNASGFNLVSSYRRDNRHIVAAVMGGSSARARDDHMAGLLTSLLPQASAGAKMSSVFKENGVGRTADAGDFDDVDEFSAASAEDAPAPVAAAAPEPTQMLALAASPAPSAPMPILPSGASHKPRIAASDVVPFQVTARETHTSADHGAAVAMARAILLPDSGKPMRANEIPTRTASLAPVPVGPTRTEEPRAVKPIQPVMAAVAPRDSGPTTTGSIPPRRPVDLAPAAKAAAQRSGWIVQIGAYDSDAAAKAAITKAKQTNGGPLARADGFTEQVGSGRLWRARFAGFVDQKGADDACKALKRKDFACLALRQ